MKIPLIMFLLTLFLVGIAQANINILSNEYNITSIDVYNSGNNIMITSQNSTTGISDLDNSLFIDYKISNNAYQSASKYYNGSFIQETYNDSGISSRHDFAVTLSTKYFSPNNGNIYGSALSLNYLSYITTVGDGITSLKGWGNNLYFTYNNGGNSRVDRIENGSQIDTIASDFSTSFYLYNSLDQYLYFLNSITHALWKFDGNTLTQNSLFTAPILIKGYAQNDRVIGITSDGLPYIEYYNASYIKISDIDSSCALFNGAVITDLACKNSNDCIFIGENGNIPMIAEYSNGYCAFNTEINNGSYNNVTLKSVDYSYASNKYYIGGDKIFFSIPSFEVFIANQNSVINICLNSTTLCNNGQWENFQFNCTQSTDCSMGCIGNSPSLMTVNGLAYCGENAPINYYDICIGNVLCNHVTITNGIANCPLFENGIYNKQYCEGGQCLDNQSYWIGLNETAPTNTNFNAQCGLCANQCIENVTRCYDNNLIQRCIYDNVTGCTFWDNYAICNTDYICNEGNCVFMQQQQQNNSTEPTFVSGKWFYIYPDASTIGNATKLFYIIATLGIIFLIFLIGGLIASLKTQNWLLLNICIIVASVIDMLGIFFFLAINYLDAGVLAIIILLGACSVGLLMVKFFSKKESE